MGIPCYVLRESAINDIAPCLKTIGCEVKSEDISAEDRGIGVRVVLACTVDGESWRLVVQDGPEAIGGKPLLLFYPQSASFVQWLKGHQHDDKLVEALTRAHLLVPFAGQSEAIKRDRSNL